MTCPNKHPLVMSADTCPFCEASRLLGENRILREGLEYIALEQPRPDNTDRKITARETLTKAKTNESGCG